MFVVGLTGGIGSGKTTVAGLLERRGAHVVDVDAIARRVTATNGALREIVDHFGDGVLAADGRLDRGRLAARVFADAADLRALEGITHPRIRRRLRRRLVELAAEGAEIVVLDHPLLVETGSDDVCDAVVVVTAPEQTRVDRLAHGRGMDPADVRARMAAQVGDERRREVATWLVDNSGDLQALASRVDDVYERIRAAAGVAGTPR